jgi:hypothetical protein
MLLTTQLATDQEETEQVPAFIDANRANESPIRPGRLNQQQIINSSFRFTFCC